MRPSERVARPLLKPINEEHATNEAFACGMNGVSEHAFVETKFGVAARI
jgi:hypothetical protein